MQPLEPNGTDDDRSATDGTSTGAPAAVPSTDDADVIDLDRIERDLDDVERTLDGLADGTYWSEHDRGGGGQDGAHRTPGPAGAAALRGTDDQSGAPA